MPFSLFYLMAVVIKRTFSRPEHFPFPVFSIGNILAGGTGKTPLVIHVASRLESLGFKVVVISSAAQAWERRRGLSDRSDEIEMMGSRLPRAGIVLKKGESLRAVPAKTGGRVTAGVIDDGFQNYETGRDLDIVTVDASNPFDNRLLLPSGLLREPISFARRADIFVISHPYMVCRKKLDRLAFKLKRFGKPVFVMDYRINGLKDGKSSLPPEAISGKEIMAVAGIGNPESFFTLLDRFNPAVLNAVSYPDHFRYTAGDIERIRKEFQRKGASLIVTTEKDYVKLEKMNPGLPLCYADISGVLLNPYEKEDFDTRMLSVLKF